MARHLKSIVKNRLNGIITRYIPNAEVSASHRRGVCYLEFIPAIKMYYGAMSTHKEGRRYNKHIIVRRVPRWGGRLHQLYTYHLPKTWSAACLANRELIKAAQQKALEPSTPEEDVTFSPISTPTRIGECPPASLIPVLKT